MRENTSGTFNTSTMRYPYKFTQTLNVSGNITISQGWNISFSSGYDFDNHAVSMTTASLQRDLHCFNMSCSVVLAPYTSYNFSFRCNASTLTDRPKIRQAKRLQQLRAVVLRRAMPCRVVCIQGIIGTIISASSCGRRRTRRASPYTLFIYIDGKSACSSLLSPQI